MSKRGLDCAIAATGGDKSPAEWLGSESDLCQRASQNTP
jgi:hypothetical protein